MKNAFKSGGEQLLKLSQSDLYKHIICPNLQSFILNSSGDPKVSKYSKSVSLIFGQMCLKLCSRHVEYPFDGWLLILYKL